MAQPREKGVIRISTSTNDDNVFAPEGDGVLTRDIQIIAEHKLDGLSLSLRYRLLRDDIFQSSSPSPNVYHLDNGALRGVMEKAEVKM